MKTRNEISRKPLTPAGRIITLNMFKPGKSFKTSFIKHLYSQNICTLKPKPKFRCIKMIFDILCYTSGFNLAYRRFLVVILWKSDSEIWRTPTFHLLPKTINISQATCGWVAWAVCSVNLFMWKLFSELGCTPRNLGFWATVHLNSSGVCMWCECYQI